MKKAYFWKYTLSTFEAHLKYSWKYTLSTVGSTLKVHLKHTLSTLEVYFYGTAFRGKLRKIPGCRIYYSSNKVCFYSTSSSMTLKFSVPHCIQEVHFKYILS